MKNLLFVIFLTVTGLSVTAQAGEPINWSFTANKIDARTYEIHLTAMVESGWHIYSQTTPKGGPVPTSITFKKNPLITIEGITKELGKLQQRYEPLFGVEVKQFADKVDFVQKIKLNATVKTTLNGIIEFMSCNEEMCLPPAEKKFSITLQ
ncbi:MAG: protein-disulfide reductase DsbD family protein [Bacteroidota bacterium]|nr:protein-disulfide reductase DsbD family protein [Bacteroidota bacterium]